MKKRLLDRQASLLEYLTSRAAIFGDIGGAPLDQDLCGIDSRLLNLEARFSHEKRMDKIVGVFPRTFEILGTKQGPIVQAFVAACPPAEIGRLANARQFHDFLSNRWQGGQPEPPYLPDVAACELACAEVRADVEERSESNDGEKNAVWRHIRRRPGIVLLHCSYDIRSIFEEGVEGVAPAERDTPIVVVMPPGAEQPRIFELPPAIFDLLATLDEWTDPAELGGAPELKELIQELAEHGLLEVGT
jgi:hypothetical protein